MFDKYLLIGAVLVACLGGISDLRSARIPNRLTYSSIVLALLLRSMLLGWPGLKSGAAGILFSGGLFFLLFAIGAVGGGDVKLIAAVSAWAGREHVLAVLLAAALFGGTLAVIWVIFSGAVRQTFSNVLALIRFRVSSGLSPHPVLNVQQATTVRVPFGVAIAMGTLMLAGNALWWR